MKVLKFGGTSVGSVESISEVKKIVEAQAEPVIVVVSALGGVTDKLISTAQMALSGDGGYSQSFNEIAQRHEDMIATVIPEGERRETLLVKVRSLLEELRSIYQGVFLIRDLSPKTQAAIVSYGERMSSLIVGALIQGAKWFDSREFIKTERQGAKNVLSTDLTNQLVTSHFSPLPSNISVMGGFISTDKDTGEVTNLGRGGSDYTASILAAALNASALEIWTDVDGFMTADPRVIQTAYTIPVIPFA